MPSLAVTRFIALLSSMFTVLLSGCAHNNLRMEEKDAYGATTQYAHAISVDAKERFIYLFRNKDGTYVCSESPPDAAVTTDWAAVGNLVGQLNNLNPTPGKENETDQIKTNIGGAVKQNLGVLGHRTASSLFLRESLFRLCEILANHPGLAEPKTVESLFSSALKNASDVAAKLDENFALANHLDNGVVKEYLAFRKSQIELQKLQTELDALKADKLAREPLEKEIATLKIQLGELSGNIARRDDLQAGLEGLRLEMERRCTPQEVPCAPPSAEKCRTALPPRPKVKKADCKAQ